MEQKKRENLAAILLSILLVYLTYLQIMASMPEIFADYNGHTHVILPQFTGDWFEGWRKVPYCLWHMGVLGLHHLLYIPLEIAAAGCSIMLSLLSFFITYWMLLKYSDAKGYMLTTTKAAFLTFGLSVLQPLYFGWLDVGDRFLGSYSMNPIHNPTHMAVRPFILLSICLVYDLWNKQKDEAYTGVFFNAEKGLKRLYIYLMIVLFLSVLAKPTFAEMFIPAVAFIMLFEWIGKIRNKNETAGYYFKHCINMLICAIPSLLYILLAVFFYSVPGEGNGTDGSFIVTKWLEVWSLFTENVVLSVVFGLAFPLFVILLDIRFFITDSLGRLTIVGYVIGFLEAALLGESGQRFSHGNFIWPMICGMTMMFLTATLRLTELEQTQGDTKTKRILIDVAWFIFWVHVLFGWLYFKESIMIG